ncbi:corticotropin-releasing factor receptor 2-like isoform X2 [Mercenaria mercenaria]|uniref:corticotropin-releasing factor receptor 2-like isoform X2 n=1 Tax=Mercenaria mercenaria TaxID=6596 RepID=UPI00234E779C|nr:corticotropin-releasing factor receptor 2-like isoform X2 [Mercenaria mercenaria]
MSEASTFFDQEIVNATIMCPHLFVNSTPPGYCSPYFDRISCWPATRANTTAQQTCPFQNDSSLVVYRYCPSNGSWENALSDYTSCIGVDPTTADPRDVKLAETLRDIYFILSTISLVFLLITIFIFQYFRSLHCSRISIHKHLVVSFIFRFIANIIITEPYISSRETSYRDLDWLCKTVTALSQYTTLANVFWMFVEGFFLHHSLVLGVFSTQAPFKLFYFIGWGLPAMFTIAWSIVLHFEHDSYCWSDYSQLNIYYIITIPFISALVVNLVFLVNIIRVLVSKLRANNHIESANIRKAIKATVVLMPLLGITNLLFVMSPSETRSLKVAYHVTNAVLHSSQGIFVAILYCFLNGEVRRVIKQKWYRYRIRHGRHPSGRRRSSRTSSFFLPSGTECPQTTEAEQLRLLQANLALRNETIENSKTSPETNHVVTNGSTNDSSTTPTFIKKNNNNGTVHFDLGYDIERETVL